MKNEQVRECELVPLILAEWGIQQRAQGREGCLCLILDIFEAMPIFTKYV